jgi:hypothetical protein
MKKSTRLFALGSPAEIWAQGGLARGTGDRLDPCITILDAARVTKERKASFFQRLSHTSRLNVKSISAADRWNVGACRLDHFTDGI